MSLLNREYLLESCSASNSSELREKTYLTLGFKNISKISKNAFQGLSRLEKLSLIYNEINEIDSDSFHDLSNLKELRLNNNRLTQIDSNLLKGLGKLEILTLMDNEISQIDPMAFQDLTNLKEVYLKGNKLKHIHGELFKGLSKLEILGLNENEISEIDAEAFRDLESLKDIGLSKNKLKHLDSTLFRGLSKLEQLGLAENQLREISGDMFVDLINLKELWIDRNRLKRIDPNAFRSFSSIGVVLLHDNDSNLNLISFFDKSIVPNEWVEFYTDILTDKAYVSEWNEFLQQFQELDQTYIASEKHDKLRSSSSRGFRSSDKNEKEKDRSRPKSTNKTTRSVTLEPVMDSFIGIVFDERYKALELLGEGTFGRVYLVLDQNEGTNKAMKVLKAFDSNWENEPYLMSRINNENIVKYFDHFELSKSKMSYACIITEFCDNDDLACHIKEAKDTGKKFKERTIFTWTLQATNGLRYLHSKEIIHRDIKPSNLLLTKYNVIKLADFGLSKLMDENKYLNSIAGAQAYMSPELFECFHYKYGEYSYNTDIWSLGCVVYELLFLRIAFRQGQRDKPRSPDLGDSLVFTPILQRMLQKDQKLRIGSQKLYDCLSATRKALDQFFE